MSEYKEIMVKKTPRWVKILIVILIISNIVGWSWWSAQREVLNINQQKLEDLRREIHHLQSRIDDLEYERDELFDDVRKLSQKPFDVSSITEPHRSHIVEDIFNRYQFWNTGQDIDDFYYKLHSEVGTATWLFEIFPGEWDVADFASHIWDCLYDAGIKSVIVVGNLNVDNAKFSESDHAWLLVLYEDTSSGDILSREKTIFILELLERRIKSIPVEKDLPLRRDMKREIDYMLGYGVSSLWAGGEEYLRGYVYTSSLDLEADIEGR